VTRYVPPKSYSPYNLPEGEARSPRSLPSPSPKGEGGRRSRAVKFYVKHRVKRVIGVLYFIVFQNDTKYFF
jgi:hypothetical protein